MNIYKKLVVLTFVLFTILGFATNAQASVPTLYLSSTSGNNVLINVTGDVNSSVTLYYNTTYGTQNTFLGYTNGLGYLSTTVSATSYNMTQGNSVYVVVNNQQSSSAVWPSAYSYNTLSLSQTNISLTAGQTSYVTASNAYGSLFVSTNSNSNVVTASVVGNSISLYGVNTGSSTVVVCQNSTTSGCGTIYVTVSGYNNYNSTNNYGFVVSNLNLSVGNSITLAAPNNAGLYVSSNSNSSVVSVVSSALNSGCYGNSGYNTITGQPCYYQTTNTGAVTLSAIGTGVSSVTLCQTGNTSACSVINVNVTGGNVYNGSVLGASTCTFYRTLKLGMTGTDVSCLQTMLASKGYLVNSNYSSYFDLQTKNAVMIFQQDNYLYADGIVGRRTASLLYN